MPNETTRREFLGMLAFSLFPLEVEKPDLINANIFTVDEAQPHAQAVAIANGRFIVVSSRMF